MPPSERSTTSSKQSVGPRLFAVWEEGSSSLRPTTGQRILVGRADDCDLVVNHASVSRHHAAITLDDRGWTIEDLGSKLGTFIDDARLSASEPTRVRDGTTLRLGDALLFLRHDRARPSPSRRPDVAREDHLPRLAAGRIPMLILGETGAGKEVLAERIHRMSPRRDAPFVRLHCAAMPPQLLESELFGHERGAFTGAVAQKTGLLETANGGTVLLDEVGELPPSAQAKLLRVLESGEVLRIGSVKPARLDVRFLSATNRDLTEMVSEGTFRADLYYRLAGHTVVVPPLRDRRREIEGLAQELIAKACTQAQRPAPRLTPEAIALLERYTWPGNIRELRNVLECAVLLASEGRIEASMLPARLRHPQEEAAPEPEPRPERKRDNRLAPLPTELDALERDRILEAIEAHGGNQTRAAKQLGISRKTLMRRLDDYGIPRPRKTR